MTSLQPVSSGKANAAAPQTVALSRPPIEHSPPLVEPLCASTTFLQPRLDGQARPTYSRVDNPTVGALETVLGRLENAPPGVCFSSGLAAETTLFLSLLGKGDHLVLSQAMYGGTVRLARELLIGLGIDVTFVDATDPNRVAAAIRDTTRLVFIETPANPTLCLNDIQAIGRIARSRDVLLAVDNTFLTPILQQPLEWGADLSVYSTTKFIEGHSTALGGAVVARNESLLDRLRQVRKSIGTIQTPGNAWNTHRGLKTLPLRIRQQSRNALWIARQLESDPRCTRVCYPGLESHSQFALAERQHRLDHGGVVSFEIGGGYDATVRFLGAVRLARLVEHVGSVETLLTHPASMTHADVPGDQLAAIGLTPSLVRLSVGLEDPVEIWADLDQAIDRALHPHRPDSQPPETPPTRPRMTANDGGLCR